MNFNKQVDDQHKPAVRHVTQSKRRTGVPWLAIGAALAASALFVRSKTRDEERKHPPIGQFIEVNGMRLHYVERGQGQPVVILHGNGSMIEDLEISGILKLAASRYRVIAFDRPGYGYSERPQGKAWTPTEQAQLLHQALQQMQIERPIIVGHSWGTLVALAMALEYPQDVQSLVLMSGYYFPTPRVDAAVNALVATPVVGDAMRYTVAPCVSRMIWPLLLRRIFGPPEVPARFSRFPVWLALRPSQLRASATEGALMVPSAQQFKKRYGELKMPVVLLAGSADRMAITDYQTRRLHQELPHSELRVVRGAGHMIYYSSGRDVMAAIDAAAAATPRPDAEQAGMPAVDTLHGARQQASVSSLHH